MKNIQTIHVTASAMTAGLVAILLSKVLIHYEIGMDDAFWAGLVAVLTPIFHQLLAKIGVEDGDVSPDTSASWREGYQSAVAKQNVEKAFAQALSNQAAPPTPTTTPGA